MPDVSVVHTADLSPAVRAAVRALLFAAFDDMADDDWDHALGGLHTLAWDGDDVVGHASVVQRRLLHGGRALRAGYVEGVAVRADHRRHGIGATLMTSVDRIVRAAYDVGGLGATDEAMALYEAHGWQRFAGRAFVLGPGGVVPTPDDEGAIYLLRVDIPLDLTGDLTCDWRPGDVW